VAEAVIDDTLDRLAGHGLVDDAAFARYWVEQRQTFRPRGRILVRAELARLGVAGEVADEAAADLEESADEDAYRAASKRARHLASLDEAGFRKRVAEWLLRRGFDWEVSARAAERLWREVSTS
jgi:regulatory protein